MLTKNLMWRERIKKGKWLVPLVLLISGGVGWQISRSLVSQNITVSFFDIGQGDSILIQAPGGRTVLIDGGPDRTVLTRLGEALPWYDHSIDLLILTHPHADHLNGLLAVLDRYQVGAVVEAGVAYQSAAYDIWHEQLRAKQIPVVRAAAGETIRFRSTTVLTILTPVTDWQNRSPRNVHDAMVVAHLSIGRESFLFTGDMEARLEGELLVSGESVAANVLKVGHHGSKTSTTPALVAATRPQVAIISVAAKNRYGHPHPQTLDTLAEAGVSILRTDQDGTVTFVCSNSQCRF